MELANQAGCYVWNPNLQKDETATWTGECSGGMAQGEGTLTAVWGENKSVMTATGLLRDGKFHGDWVVRHPNGAIGEGPMVDGKMHGRWTIREADGDVWEGPYGR